MLVQSSNPFLLTSRYYFFDYIPLDTEEQIISAFGEWFCNAVGIQNILQMQRDNFEDVFNPSFKIFQPCKGIRKNYPTPFIACTIEVSDFETKLSQYHVLFIAKHPKHPELKHPDLDSYGIYIKWSDTKEWELISHLHENSKDAKSLHLLFDGIRINNYCSADKAFLGMPGKSIQLAYVW